MDIIVREHCEEDLPQMIEIWNEVVEEGIAFPQIELLNEKTGRPFFLSRLIQRWQKIWKATPYMGSIFCIPIILGDVAILAMQVMR